MISSSKNNYRTYKSCRFCYSKKITKILGLGNIPLAGGFLKTLKEVKNEKFYPLELYFCKNCYLVQTGTVINSDILFKKYFYSSSAIKTLVAHFSEFAVLLKEKFPKSRLIVEIGSNDGIFLKELNRNGFKTLGVEPSQNLTKPLLKQGIDVINDYFTENLANKILEKNGHADIIVSSNTLAHIEDMHDVVRGIKTLLRDDGVLIFENHYLGDLIKDSQYDMIYHEHQYYYSLLTLIKFFASFDMEIYDVNRISIHGGSLRFYVQKKLSGKKKITNRVNVLVREEKRMGLDKLNTYEDFEKKVNKNRKDLIKLLQKLKSTNKKIVGYGASGRGTVISNYCNLNHKLLDYIVDDSKLKQGFITPGTHLRIYSSSIIKTDKPDYAVVFAWAFINEIKNKNIQFVKNGGKFIIPLPKVKII